MVFLERLCRTIRVFLIGSAARKGLRICVPAAQLVLVAVFAQPLLSFGAAMAQMQTIRTEENGVVHHRLERCDYERGVAVASYSFRKHSPYRPPESQITDICFDRKGGRLWASEPEDRLTLVQQDEQWDQYEVLVPDFPRWRASVTNYEQASGNGGYRAGSVDFDYQRLASELLNWNHTGTQLDGDVRLHGYIFDTQPSPDIEPSDFKVYVGGSDQWDHLRGRDEKYRDREVPYLSFEGVLRFDGSKGVVNLRNTSNTGKEGAGKLFLTVNDKGEISGSGTLTVENARLAGIRPHDWKTTTWEIRKLVGHMVGDGGEQFRAVGIADGQTVDQDGFVNPVHASIEITGYSRRIAELWDDGSELDGE
ncbi:hypothetical protein ACFPOD_03740 [Nitratireductor kimnyeongensis]|uniref:Uncharacterized protein n=1 Tax=Nitratireductor kimnyeongensis TaxID=430679 RepID=A0ABW0T529_9HYPH|nr:hypothetical protein [Nitratireductor kimnyeongensis]QZZ34787.1 hypothetical protein KW403_13445 [Nitratireductor kimnyeongensis]